MTNLEKLNKKWKSSLGKGAYKWSNEDITELLLALSSSLNKDLKGMKCDCKCNCQK